MSWPEMRACRGFKVDHALAGGEGSAQTGARATAAACARLQFDVGSAGFSLMWAALPI
jgi:hypothetical protein